MARLNTLPVLLLFCILSLAHATGLTTLKLTESEPKRCVNIGSWFDANGPFEAELGLVKYNREPPVLNTSDTRDISRTSFNRAFRVQRSAKRIRFSLRVSPKFKYTVTTAHAEVIDRFCKEGRRVMKVTVNGQSKVVDIFKAGGCFAAVFVEFKGVRAKNRLINVTVRGIKGKAAIAGVCIGRTSFPRPSPVPRPSKSPSPRPSRRPRPSKSSTPRPTPSNSPKPPLVPSECTQEGCMNFDGHGDYEVIGNSMSLDEDRENCAMASSSKAWLRLPAGAVVKKAILYWSASGSMTKEATAILNGNTVTATKTYFGGSSGYYFYGAEADVTHIVSSDADYTVSKIWYDNSGRLCRGNAAYAAWSIVVVYELRSLPNARINVCTDNFKFTFPSGTYSSYVDCISGSRSTRNARTTVVTFESDSYKGEYFFLNDYFIGDNLFRGTTAPNLDIRDFEITPIVRSMATSIKYTVQSYFVHSRFGPAIEGLFMPIRVVYHTLPH